MNSLQAKSIDLGSDPVTKEWSLSFDYEEICRRMGMPKAVNRMSADFDEVIKRVQSKAGERITARCLYRILPILPEDNSIRFANGRTIPVEGDFFQGASHAVLAVVTLGKELEKTASDRFDEGEMVEGLVWDACGNAGVDEALEMLRKEIAERTSSMGMQMGYNIGPGGGTIPLYAQDVVFLFVEASKIGVELKESYLMVPVKSSSVLIPVGEKLLRPNSSFSKTCELCSARATCQNRKAD